MDLTPIPILVLVGLALTLYLCQKQKDSFSAGTICTYRPLDLPSDASHQLFPTYQALLDAFDKGSVDNCISVESPLHKLLDRFFMYDIYYVIIEFQGQATTPSPEVDWTGKNVGVSEEERDVLASVILETGQMPGDIALYSQTECIQQQDKACLDFYLTTVSETTRFFSSLSRPFTMHPVRVKGMSTKPYPFPSGELVTSFQPLYLYTK